MTSPDLDHLRWHKLTMKHSSLIPTLVAPIIHMAAFIAALTVQCFAQTNGATTEPAGGNVIATVLGKQITASDKDKLNGLIFGALLQQFAQENKIEPTEEELNTFVLKTEEKEKQQQIKMQAILIRKRLISFWITIENFFRFNIKDVIDHPHLVIAPLWQMVRIYP